MGKLTKLNRAARRLAKKAKRKADKVLGRNAGAGKFVRVAKLPKESRLARARLRGWNDVARDKPYRETYDTWKKSAQLAYERGRMEATRAKMIALRIGRDIDVWKMSERIEGPMFRAVGPEIGLQVIEEMRGSIRSVK